MRRHVKCGHEVVVRAYSEDFATVYDFECPGCGQRFYEYVGAQPNGFPWPHSYERAQEKLNQEFPEVES